MKVKLKRIDNSLVWIFNVVMWNQHEMSQIISESSHVQWTIKKLSEAVSLGQLIFQYYQHRHVLCPEKPYLTSFKCVSIKKQKTKTKINREKYDIWPQFLTNKMLKFNPRTLWGFSEFFFLEDKTSAPDVFSGCLFIPCAHFETSSVFVSFNSWIS